MLLIFWDCMLSLYKCEYIPLCQPLWDMLMSPAACMMCSLPLPLDESIHGHAKFARTEAPPYMLQALELLDPRIPELDNDLPTVQRASLSLKGRQLRRQLCMLQSCLSSG